MFDIGKFRKKFPEFDSADDETILLWAEDAEIFAGTIKCKGSEETLLMYVTAHLLALNLPSEQGGSNATGGQVTGVTVDKVSLSFKEISSKSDYASWLNTTKYGQMAVALINRCSGLPYYTNKVSVLAAYRRANGKFRGRR